MIEVESIRMRFRHHEAVTEPESFTIRPGSICLVTGRNGVGKSTFLNVLNAINVPAQGTIRIDGQLVQYPGSRRPRTDAADLANWGVARLFQETRYFFGRSVSDHLNALLPGRRPPPAVMDLLSAAGVAETKTRLSSGQHRLVNIALALATGTRWCILDEPLARLDTTRIAAVVEVMRAVSHSGVGLIVVEHRLNVLTPHADQAVRIIDAGARF